MKPTPDKSKMIDRMVTSMRAINNLCFPACLMDDPATASEAIYQSILADIAQITQEWLPKELGLQLKDKGNPNDDR